MPLTALVDGRRVVAPLLADDEWERILTANPMLPCDARAVSKQIKKSGTRYFAHWPGSHCDVVHKRESAEHLRAKEIIVQAAIAAGWHAAKEVPAEDRAWIADVLVTDGVHTVALEVQWSQQEAEEYHRRHARYLAAGIDTYWFARHRSTWGSPGVQVPVFALAFNDDEFTAEQGLHVQLGGQRRTSLADMVTTLLNGYPRRWCPLSEMKQGVVVQWIWNRCWKCDAWSQIWRCPDTRAFRCDGCRRLRIVSSCRVGASFLDPRNNSGGFFPSEPTAEMSEEVTAVIQGALEKPARIGLRFTRQSGVKHFGYHCPACTAPIGTMYLMAEKQDSWREDQVLMGSSKKVEVAVEDGGHWC